MVFMHCGINTFTFLNTSSITADNKRGVNKFCKDVKVWKVIKHTKNLHSTVVKLAGKIHTDCCYYNVMQH